MNPAAARPRLDRALPLRRRSTRAACLWSVLGLTLVACAGDDSDGGDDDQPAPATLPASVPTPSTGGTTTDAPDDGATEPADDPTAASGDSTTAAGPSTTGDPTAPDDQPTTTEGPPASTGPLPAPTVALIPVGTFDGPIDLAWRFLDPRLFVIEQRGRILAFDDESGVPVLDIGDLDGVGLASGNEQGLLGLAFHPDDDLAYVNLTDASGTTIVAEFAIDPVTAEFDVDSYREVLTIDQPFSNHNGGDLAFGPDRMLYLATGDGGSSGDPQRASLDLTSRLGKLLRIDPRPSPDGRPFTVPTDNPFLGADDADPTIWSYGLRNPWKFSFDDVTKDLWIGDVGQNEFEEISFAPATDGRDAGRAVSFGWSAFEGNARFNDDQPEDGHVPPIVTYPHSDGGCSVSGGAVARASSYPDLNGWFVYGDFCSGQIWALDTTSVTISDSTLVGEPRLVEIANVPQLTAVRVGPDGDLYAVSRSGTIARIVQG